MKTRTLGVMAVLTATLVLPALADEARVNQYKSQFRALRVTELPREAATAAASDKTAVADVVAAAISVNGMSAPLIVGSVAKAVPQSAAGASGTAVSLQPKLAALITKAAVSASPSEVEGIVSSMCKARPLAFYAIGVSAAEAAPKAEAQILNAITEAIPALKPVVKRAQADFAKANRTASLALVLKHSVNLVAALARDSKETTEILLAKEDTAVSVKLASAAFDIPPPVQGPPFVPGGPTPGEINTSGTVEVAPVRTEYSAP